MWTLDKTVEICNSIGLFEHNPNGKFRNRFQIKEFYFTDHKNVVKAFNWTSAVVMYKYDFGIKLLNRNEDGSYKFTNWLLKDEEIDEAFKNLTKFSKEIKSKVKLCAINKDF